MVHIKKTNITKCYVFDSTRHVSSFWLTVSVKNIWLHVLSVVLYESEVWRSEILLKIYITNFYSHLQVYKSRHDYFQAFLCVVIRCRRKEGNVLFNDALNTFYLRLYGVRYMVKDHSDSERGNPLPPHRLLFPICSKGSFICSITQTG